MIDHAKEFNLKLVEIAYRSGSAEEEAVLATFEPQVPQVPICSIAILATNSIQTSPPSPPC